MNTDIMAEEIDKAGLKLLQRGVLLDNEKRYTEALLCYQEGMQILIDFMKSMLDPDKKKFLADKVKGYMSRAETLKTFLKKQKEEGKYHEELKIEKDSIGHSYENVFGRFLDEDVLEITVEDAYIRSFPQCQNFLRFCELAVRKCKQLKQIILRTSPATEQKDIKNQQENLQKIKNNLQQQYEIELIIEYNPNLHDRQITLSSGWVIKIGRGLDYFQRVDQFSLGFFDQSLKPCWETTVDIYHKKATRPL